jgi:hypothetical protein
MYLNRNQIDVSIELESLFTYLGLISSKTPIKWMSSNSFGYSRPHAPHFMYFMYSEHVKQVIHNVYKFYLAKIDQE